MPEPCRAVEQAVIDTAVASTRPCGGGGGTSFESTAEMHLARLAQEYQDRLPRDEAELLDSLPQDHSEQSIEQARGDITGWLMVREGQPVVGTSEIKIDQNRLDDLTGTWAASIVSQSATALDGHAAARSDRRDTAHPDMTVAPASVTRDGQAASAPRRALRSLGVLLLVSGALALIALTFASGSWVAGAMRAGGLVLAAGLVALLGDQLERRAQRHAQADASERACKPGDSR